MIITYMCSEESEVVSRAANLLTDDAKPALQFGLSPARANGKSVRSRFLAEVPRCNQANAWGSERSKRIAENSGELQ